MPELVRLYLRNIAYGFLLAVAFVALLLWFNVANLWHLVTSTDGGALAVVMLVLGNAIVFSGVQFAIAVMRMADPEGGSGGGRKRPEPVVRAELVRVPVTARSRR